MTTITIERGLLEQAIRSFVGYRRERMLILGDEENEPCDAEKALREALSAPATAPEKTVKEIMEFVRHYAADTFSSATLEDKIRRSLAASATAPAWYDAQQAEIESLRWTVKDALESLDNGMTADCRATLSSATKETP